MEEFLLKFEAELHICLPGFVMCILPGIDDQNEGMSKKVEKVLRKTERIVGTRLFFATLWQTILRSSRTRMGGLKYLQRGTLPRNLEQAKETEIFPVSKTISMQDQAVSVLNAAGSEFYDVEMERKARLSQEDYDYFYYPCKGKLVTNALLSCLSDTSVYVNRYALDLMISHMPIHSDQNSHEMNVTLV
jgi:hypothetical protein